ncbi:DUF6916 family protein [Fodinibius halophilus]|uniref:DUF6916 domain-containing protein n=1 Tax=Fodinibius halophilus TaxID=1736908 RepID=A0A6M1T810_9BACT|nr:hypothetical protein [Fodinibius halophilus]NGP90209.1 hypothetical protein [Fodinibius halophilus]
MKPTDFSPFENKEVKAKTKEGDDLNLTLKKVTTLESKGLEAVEGVRSEPFRLTLSGPADKHLEQQVVKLYFNEDNPHELFIKPLGKEEGISTYEVIIN